MKLGFAAVLAVIAAPACAQGETLPADETAVFTGAGFTKQDGQWTKCGDPGTASYQPGRIDATGDLKKISSLDVDAVGHSISSRCIESLPQAGNPPRGNRDMGFPRGLSTGANGRICSGRGKADCL